MPDAPCLHVFGDAILDSSAATGNAIGSKGRLPPNSLADAASEQPHSDLPPDVGLVFTDKPSEQSGVVLCDDGAMHPYFCEAGCVHCLGTITPSHHPKLCALCQAELHPDWTEEEWERWCAAPMTNEAALARWTAAVAGWRAA